jgi:hypothetical protein
MVIHIVWFRSALADKRIAGLFQVPASEYLARPRSRIPVLPRLMTAPRRGHRITPQALVPTKPQSATERSA